jgi:WD40 repeat protein
MIPRPSYHQSRAGGGGGGGSNKVKDRYKATSVAIWETLGGIKLFVGSQDGKWRLYNTAPTTATNTTTMNHNNNASSNGNTISGVSLTQEFEHYVGGPIDTIHLISSHYFCVGFEISSPLEAPLDTNKAGMVHIWNLSSPGDAPLELMMNTRFAKYASSGRVRCLCTGSAGIGGEGRVWSGGNDGVIREWAMTNTATPTLVRTMSGHLGAVTKLTLSKNGVLWSGGSDGTIRLWNIENGEMAHLIPAVKKDTVAGGDAASTAAAMLGHSGSITGLLPFEVPSADPSSAGGASPPSSFIFTSSLDETVKVWDATNGSCVASEKHGQGVTSIAFTSDSSGVHPLLLCGLYYGDIMIRGTISNPPLCLLLKISHNFVGVGHELGPVHDIQAGPGCTFYAVGEDGKLTVWQIVGDFGL